LRKLTLLVAFLMAFSITLVSMSGCAKKQAPPPKEEPAAGQMEEAAPDTTAVMEEPAE
jgi:hypothetical protein